MTDPAADAARAAAVILAPGLGPGLPAEVEAALYTRESGAQGPRRYDPGLAVGAASLIVTIAQLAWSIVSDRREHTAKPSHEAVVRQVRIALRHQDRPLPPDTDRITEVVITEIIRLEDHP
jgi:hypothetical protein